MPIGLLRHSASGHKGLSLSLYPSADLEHQLNLNNTYESEGTTYVRNSSGTDIPVISGTGTDMILDMSVLEDDRFNKGAVVGNSEGFPEYWDSPWNAYFYYDDTSAATLYHWKIKDFHYAYILEQSASVDNVFFLKAKATTDTSNEIDVSYGLLVYSSEQDGNNLTKLKSWIRLYKFTIEDNKFFSEYFDSEQAVIDNGGELTDVEFEDGQAYGTSIFSKIIYDGVQGTKNVVSYRLKTTIPTGEACEFLNSNGDNTGNRSRIFNTSSGIGIWLNSGFVNYYNGVKFLRDKEIEIVFTISSTTIKYYIDGELVLTKSQITNQIYTGAWQVGRSKTSGYFNQQMNLVEAYEKELSSDEVKNL